MSTSQIKIIRQGAHADTIRSLAFNQASSRLASISVLKDPALTIWDASQWIKLRTMKVDGTITTMVFSSDDTVIYGSGFTSTIHFWQVLSGQHGTILFPSSHTTLRVKPGENKMVAVGCKDNQLIFFDIESGKAQKTLTVPESKSALHNSCGWISEDLGFIVVEDKIGSIAVFDLHHGQLVSKVDGHEGSITDVKFDLRSQLLYTCGEDKTIKLWSMQHSNLLQSITTTMSYPSEILIHPSKPIITVINEEEYVEVWEMEQRKHLLTLSDMGSQMVGTISPDGHWLACGNDTGDLFIADFLTF